MDLFVEVFAVIGFLTVIKCIAVRSGWTRQIATYRLSTRVERRLQYLGLSLHCSRTEIFRRALTIFDHLFKAAARDAEIIIREPDGSELPLQMVPHR